MNTSASALAAVVALTGCAGTVNRFILDDVVAFAASDGDTGKACAMGAALTYPLAGFSHRADLSLAIAEGVSGVCDQTLAWEADLRAARTQHNAAALGEGRAAEIIDAQLSARRAHARTAARFERSFAHAESALGSFGAGCPSLSPREEFTYLFALIAGTFSMFHDSAAGGVNGVPLDRLTHIARASLCLSDEVWWHVPAALRGASAAMVPGSGPPGVDGWQMLHDAAMRGATSGVRVALAIEALVAYNAGRTELLTRAIELHAQSRQTTPVRRQWSLLDTYATEISTHQSDLLWSESAGHRTEVFGRLPGQTTTAPTETPFGQSDPFSTP